MPSCRSVTRIVSDALDRRLPWRRRVVMRWHLLICPKCARFRRQILFLREIINRYVLMERKGRPFLPAVLAPETRARIRRALEHESP